jgi:membrane protein YqaA with SNARE-associated domain
MKAFIANFKALLISWGPLGMFVATLIDGAGVPNPSGPDFLLLLFAVADPQDAYLGAGLGVLGSLIGSYILYSIGRKGGELLLRKHTEGKWGQIFHRWFLRYGLVTVFVPALIPIPMPLKVFVLCSGALGIRPLPFLATIAAGRIPRYFGLAYIGRELGENSLQWFKDHTVHFLLFGVGLLVALYLLVRVVERFRNVPEEA